MKQRQIILKDLKPIGPLSSMLKKFDKQISLCEKEGYTKEVARLVKLLYDFGLLDAEDWFKETIEKPEVEIIVLYSRILLCRLNNIAQKDLNNIIMKPISVQLMEDTELMKFFPNTILI